MDISMRISPNYKVKHWIDLVPKLSTEEGWCTATEILRDRIEGRFLNLIKIIEGKTYAGFAVLALDCLLIETLQQFRNGVEETPSRKSCEYFKRFLTETSFGQYFNERKAEMFYRQIRCGIVHQGEIKGRSRVSIKSTDPLVRETEDGKDLIINRRLFHDQLVDVFEDYVYQLHDPSEHVLRENFKKKMDYICQCESAE